jgi:hypothetical protein
MADKIYEMDDSYKQAVADLLEFIELRHSVAETVKFAPPDKIREVQEILATMDKKIEEGEAALAKEYDSYQTYQKALEDEAEMMDVIMDKMQKYYVLVKHRMPEKLDEWTNDILKGWTPDEIQNFYDGAAIIEATRLDEVLGAPKDAE